jgi:hypothetical protein
MYPNNYGGGNAANPANMNNYYNNAYGLNIQPQYMREPQSTATPMYTSPMSNQFLKGRPVSSFEEARAAQVDFDGSLHIFTDIGNKKIYTKQINLDGTATLNVYSLEEPTTVENQQQVEYVTKIEFSEEIEKIQSLLNLLIPKDNKEQLTFKNF